MLLVFLFSFAAYFVAASFIPVTIVVQWTTANEVNTAGFNVYRSQNPNGPYAKLNTNLISASTDPLAGGKYRYEDTNVTPGQTYYYHVEDVEYSGASARHGPIVSTAPSAWDLSKGLGVLLALSIGFLIVVGARAYRARKETSRVSETREV